MSKVFTKEMSQDICERIFDEFNKKDNDPKFILELIKQVPLERIDTQTEHHDTFLVFASDAGYIEIAKYLLDNGANINGTFDDSPLALALYRNNLEMAELLLKNNDDVNIKTIGHDSSIINGPLFLSSTETLVQEKFNLLAKYNVFTDLNIILQLIFELFESNIDNSIKLDIIKLMISNFNSEDIIIQLISKLFETNFDNLAKLDIIKLIISNYDKNHDKNPK